MLIGLCGGSCAGKTTISNKLKELLGDSISIISLDNYYISYPQLSYEQRKNVNYDEPQSIDVDTLLSDIHRLKAGSSITQPSFSFETFLNERASTITNPANFILIEGLFVLSYPSLVEQLDLKLFVDSDSDIRLARRILRDMKVHHRTIEFIIDQYFNYVKPMYELYIEPQRELADCIISGNKEHNLLSEIIPFLK